MITNQQIDLFRAEAVDAYDQTAAKLCEDALAGDEEARAVVESMLDAVDREPASDREGDACTSSCGRCGRCTP